MFCPNCGVHQGGDRKFCPSCGQNLAVVSQAMGGQFGGPAHQAPGVPTFADRRRQEDLAKGVKLTIIGGAFLAIQFFGFIFSIPFRGGSSPFGFFSFVAFVLMAVGVSKLVNARPVVTQNRFNYQAQPQQAFHQAPQQSVMPDFQVHPDAPPTGDLVDTRQPVPSVTEDDTQHLPHHGPPPNQM